MIQSSDSTALIFFTQFANQVAALSDRHIILMVPCYNHSQLISELSSSSANKNKTRSIRPVDSLPFFVPSIFCTPWRQSQNFYQIQHSGVVCILRATGSFVSRIFEKLACLLTLFFFDTFSFKVIVFFDFHGKAAQT